ncbi:hypothetical protein [Acinetobacter dispersus]|uniref:Glycosyl transferase family 1 domain-containing protein n=1 Tax=Acinetobacter dispersus TaxID=70348 RepID=N9LDM6_9GAMM|nr:hypothetical protein [Acinetobacter dispersus]ENW94382.1 hypothetical protein F904_01308 [Acinetobacter dispersus]
MKVLLICPTNLKFMPYVDSYLSLLKENNISYTFLIWDRFLEEDDSCKNVFKRGPKKHQRGFFDYYLFGRFVRRHLDDNEYHKIICFGLQTAFFIRGKLRSKYSKNFIIDVRDHNKIVSLYNFENLISHSAFTVISSSGYLSWLPKEKRYLVNHNFYPENLSNIYDVDFNVENKVFISSIGALRDLEVNLKLIEKLDNDEEIQLNFHGHGDINSKLELSSVNFRNVEITGYYEKENEVNLYRNANLVNVLRYSDGINNHTALPNRLYLAPYFGRPLFAYSGTYLAQVIEKYELGLVIDSFDNVRDAVFRYFADFDALTFDKARRKFLNEIIDENSVFKREFHLFIHQVEHKEVI